MDIIEPRRAEALRKFSRRPKWKVFMRWRSIRASLRIVQVRASADERGRARAPRPPRGADHPEKRGVVAVSHGAA
jgi:hypothetical protein